MHNIHIFNPDNDLALAFGGENYTAPPLATQLRHDLQMLPLWYGRKDAIILADAFENQEWINEMCNIFEFGNPSIIKSRELTNTNSRFSPWGWSLDMRKRLIDQGVNINNLPSKDYINTLRNLSHRSTSILIHNNLRDCIDFEYPPTPVELCDFNSIREFAICNPCCYIKAPWSSSGKGVFKVLDINAIDFQRWCSGILSRQKSVLCEVALDKVLDFAMEYHCIDGKAKFVGYSVFTNDKHCSFDSGLVMNTQMLHQYITNIFPNEKLLIDIQHSLAQILSTLVAEHYTGYLGVDMMLYNDNEVIKINPCIEMNLRTTMGMVTSIIGNNFIAPTSRGRFFIEYLKKPIDTLDYRKAKIKANPPKYIAGRLVSGIQFLTPHYPNARYTTHLEISQ